MPKNSTFSPPRAGTTNRSSSRGTTYGQDRSASYGQDRSGGDHPSGDHEVHVAEKPARRPSTRLVAGAALLGGLTAGAIPFLLARRSAKASGPFEGAGEASTGRSAVGEQRIPIVEEQLLVGKKEVARARARVHSYIEETPVHEQVSLREEHISIERQPIDQVLDEGDLSDGDVLRERTIDMTEMAEEPVVEKEARLREELVIKKTAQQRTAEVEDTVRRTKVDIDEGRSGDAGAAGSTGAYESTGKDREI